MRDKHEWADVIRQWFDEVSLPAVRKGDTAGRPPGYAAAEGTLIRIVTRNGQFRGDLLGITEPCLLLFRASRVVAFIDWQEIVAIRVRPYLPHSLKMAAEVVCEVVKQSTAPEAARKAATNLLKATLDSLRNASDSETANARELLARVLVATAFEPHLEERSGAVYEENRRLLVQLLVLGSAKGQLSAALNQALAICFQKEEAAIGCGLEEFFQAVEDEARRQAGFE